MNIEVTNAEDLNDIIDIVELYKAKAVEIANELAKLQNSDFRFDCDEIIIDDGMFVAQGETYRYGETEYFNISIPSEYFFSNDWRIQAQKDFERKKKIEEERKRKAKEKAELRKLENDKKLYLKLKEKFED